MPSVRGDRSKTATALLKYGSLKGCREFICILVSIPCKGLGIHKRLRVRFPEIVEIVKSHASWKQNCVLSTFQKYRLSLAKICHGSPLTIGCASTLHIIDLT